MKVERSVLAVTVAAAAAHLALAATTELSPDEAYYLAAARRAPLSLEDHPPLVPLALRLLDRIAFLPVELRVRLLPVVCSVGTTLALVALARRLGAREQGLALVAATTGFSVLGLTGGFVATPDGPLVLGMALALLAATAAPAALAMAAALASKVAAFPLAAALALDRARPRGARAGVAIGALAALAIVVPSLRFQLHHAFAREAHAWSASAAVRSVLEAVLVQAVLWSPWLLVRGARDLARLGDGPRWFVLAWTALILASALVRATPPEANWWAPAALLVLVAALLRAHEATRRTLVAIAASLGIPALVAASHAVHPWLPLPPPADPTARLHGWKNGSAPADAAGVGPYGVAAERCVYQADCDAIDAWLARSNR